MIKQLIIIVVVSTLAGVLTVFLMGKVVLYIIDHTLPERGVYSPEVTMSKSGRWLDTEGNTGCYGNGACNSKLK